MAGTRRVILSFGFDIDGHWANLGREWRWSQWRGEREREAEWRRGVFRRERGMAGQREPC